MSSSTSKEILLVEDNPGDARLIEERFKAAAVPVRLHTLDQGDAVLPFLRQEGPHATAPRPDLIILDLNIPQMDGQDILATIKRDEHLKAIPVIVLTTGDEDTQVCKAYHHQANCYICKPMTFEGMQRVLSATIEFWLKVVKLPPR